jgi:hypothetical protein
MILKFSIIWMLFNVAQALIAYDCSAEESKFSVVSLISEPVCSRTSTNIKEETTKIQVLQSKKYDTVPYFQCLVTYDIVATHCATWFGDNLLATQYSHVMEISREKCKQMHVQRDYSDPQFPGIHVSLAGRKGEYVGYVVGSNEDNSCKGSVFHSHKRNIGVLRNVAVHAQIHVKLSTGLGSVELKTDEIVLTTGVRAIFSEMSTFDFQNGNTFWTTLVREENCLTDQVFVVYQGIAVKLTDKLADNSTRIVYVVKIVGEDRDFLIEAKSNITICGGPAFTTPSANLFVVESPNGLFMKKMANKLDARNLDMQLMASLKISHLAHDVGRQLSELYSDLMFEKCLTDSKVILNMLALAKIDPKDWGYLFFKQPGYVGTVRSEVIYLQQCSAVNVTHRESMDCYQELPVTYGGKARFMTPRSRVLVDIGTKVECSNTLHNMYKINDAWYIRAKGVLISTKEPFEVSLKPTTSWEYKPLDNLDGGLYSSEQVESFHKVIFAPLNQPAEVQNLVNVMNGNFGHDENSVKPHRMFSAEDWNEFRENLQQSLWEFIKKTATSIGDMASFLIGLFFIIKGIKLIANTIINGFIITYAFGFFNYRILFSCWSHMVSLFLHHDNIVRERNEDVEMATIEPTVQQPRNDVNEKRNPMLFPEPAARATAPTSEELI